MNKTKNREKHNTICKSTSISDNKFHRDVLWSIIHDSLVKKMREKKLLLNKCIQRQYFPAATKTYYLLKIFFFEYHESIAKSKISEVALLQLQLILSPILRE